MVVTRPKLRHGLGGLNERLERDSLMRRIETWRAISERPVPPQVAIRERDLADAFEQGVVTPEARVREVKHLEACAEVLVWGPMRARADGLDG